MMIFLDESGDLGWSLDKPYLKGGASRFITIAGIAIEEKDLKYVIRHVYDLCKDSNHALKIERKGAFIPGAEAVSIVQSLDELFIHSNVSRIVAITAEKRNVLPALKRDANVFYNHLLNRLSLDLVQKFPDVNFVLDNRTVRMGSINSFEDCLRAKCWGELGLETNISCRFENSLNSPAIWLADWLSNFIWRHYENKLHEPYLECLTHRQHFHEKTIFMKPSP